MRFFFFGVGNVMSQHVQKYQKRYSLDKIGTAEQGEQAKKEKTSRYNNLETVMYKRPNKIGAVDLFGLLPELNLAGFEEFWRLYPVKKARRDAEKVWDKLRPDEALQRAIDEALARQRAEKSVRRAKGLFVPDWPYPATWLNGRRWEDVLLVLDELEDEAEWTGCYHTPECQSAADHLRKKGRAV